MRVEQLTNAVVGPLLILSVFIAVLYVPGSESPTTLVVGGTLLLALPTMLAGWRRRLVLTAPTVVLPAAYYLTTFHAPLARLVLGGRSIDFFETQALANSVYAAAGVALIVEVGGAFLDWGRVRFTELDPAEAKSNAAMGTGVTLTGFAMLAVWIDTVGSSALLDASLGDVYLLAGGHTTITFALPFASFGIVTTADALARWRGGSPVLWRVANWGSAGLLALIVARGGARGPVIELTVAVVLMLTASGVRLRRRTVVSVGAVVLAFFFVVSTTRGDLSSGLGTTPDAVVSNVRKSMDVETRSEFDGVFANSAMITRLVGNAIPYREGRTYLDLPLQMVPRQLVSSKAPPLSVWWVQYVDPALAAQGGGLAFSSYGEGYLNFGAVGAIVQICAVTLLLLSFYWLLRSKRTALRAAAAVILAHSYHCHRSESVHVAFIVRNALLIALFALTVDAVLRALGHTFSATTRRLPRSDVS